MRYHEVRAHVKAGRNKKDLLQPSPHFIAGLHNSTGRIGPGSEGNGFPLLIAD
jgi:hypothetical protein